jgi:hypothetical protein
VGELTVVSLQMIESCKKLSNYGSYVQERSNDHILEVNEGFATYRYLDDGKSVYIIDIFVAKEHRESQLASTLADTIVREAKQKGCTELLGTVCPQAKNSTISLKVLLGYGMTLKSSSDNLIVFSKEIK